MSKPYIYVATSKVGSRPVTRAMPTDVGSFARVVVGFPDARRSLEIFTDYRGIWQLSSRPSPAHSGPVHEIASGELPRFVEHGRLLPVQEYETVQFYPHSRVSAMSTVLPNEAR